MNLSDEQILRIASEWQTRARTSTIILNSEVLDYSRMLLAHCEPIIRAEERAQRELSTQAAHDNRVAFESLASGQRLGLANIGGTYISPDTRRAWLFWNRGRA